MNTFNVDGDAPHGSLQLSDLQMHVVISLAFLHLRSSSSDAGATMHLVETTPVAEVTFAHLSSYLAHSCPFTESALESPLKHLSTSKK